MNDKRGNWMNLKVGDRIRIGKKYAKEHNCTEGEIITLIKGIFDEYNGLFTEEKIAPSIYNEDEKEFDSIYHLFGNDLEDFMDCEVLKNDL